MKFFSYIDQLFKRKIIILILLVITLPIIPGCTPASSPVPVAEKGVLDLREWDFASRGIVQLNGQWEFYWKKFITPGSKEFGEAGRYCTVPGPWTSAGEDITSRGYASYRLTILMPKKRAARSLKFRNIHTSYRAFVNGELAASQGKADRYSDNSRPETIFQSSIIDGEEKIELVIHVSNYYHKDSGIIISIKLGRDIDIVNLNERAVMVDFFIFGSIIVIAFYYLMLFILRTEDQALLFFSLFCFIVAIRIFIFGNINYRYVSDAFSWYVIFRTAILSFFMAVLFFSWYVYNLYREEFSKYVLNAITTTLMVLIVIALFADTMLVSRIVSYSHILTLLICFYILNVIIRAARNRREGASIFLSGFVIILGVIINDILYDNLVIQTAFLLPAGLFIFLILQTIILSQRYTSSFARLKELSEKLDQNNDTLIQALVNLKFSQERLIQQEKMAAAGNLAAGMAHEIRNQLSAITFLELIDTQLSGEEKKDIEAVFESRDQIGGIVNEVRALAKNETADYSFSTCFVDNIINETMALSAISPSIKHQSITCQVNYGGPLLGDRHKLIQLLIHLLENASSAVETKGKITLTTALENEKVIFEVLDTGIGIESAIRDEIWAPFFSSWGKDHAGIGLDLCQRIALGHQGKIVCSSRAGEGTSFSVILPLGDIYPDSSSQESDQ